MGESQTQIREILAKNDVLGHLLPEDLDHVAKLAVTKEYPGRRTIFSRGDAGTAMMVVLNGRVQISGCDADGRERVIAVLGPGEVLGEIAFIDGGGRTADAVTLERTKLLVLSRREFFLFLEKNPKVAIRLLEIMCDRMRKTDDKVFLSGQAVDVRLAREIVVLSERFGIPTPEGIQIVVSQQDLGNMIGAVREAVNKQLGIWEDEGLVVLGRRAVTVVDQSELRRLYADAD